VKWLVHIEEIRARENNNRDMVNREKELYMELFLLLDPGSIPGRGKGTFFQPLRPERL
jgi:hypothetical protein